ncbi:MAG: sigma-70 family RNA polymerase sigma factor [Chloroflexi bacterium]|nr:sigma-70 family RNA polymerase sigma factor [Chloroflexota bacterium]
MRNMDEEALIRAAQQGDVNAYNALVLHYQSLAFNVALRIIGEADAAADATQEGFISAYHALDRFRGGSFKSWLLRIVTNACYDEMRRRKRRPQSSLDAVFTQDDSAGTAQFATEGDDPEEIAESRELQQAILNCLQELPEEQRVIAIMADVEGFSYEEIADVTGIALGTVKSRLSRTRRRLRDCLQAYRELLPSSYRLADD